MELNAQKTTHWIDAHEALHNHHAHFSIVEIFATIVFLGLIVGIVAPLFA